MWTYMTITYKLEFYSFHGACLYTYVDEMNAYKLKNPTSIFLKYQDPYCCSKLIPINSRKRMQQSYNNNDRVSKGLCEKSVPAPFCSTPIPLDWTNLGVNSSLHGEKPATNRLLCRGPQLEHPCCKVSSEWLVLYSTTSFQPHRLHSFDCDDDEWWVHNDSE